MKNDTKQEPIVDTDTVEYPPASVTPMPGQNPQHDPMKSTINPVPTYIYLGGIALGILLLLGLYFVINAKSTEPQPLADNEVKKAHFEPLPPKKDFKEQSSVPESLSPLIEKNHILTGQIKQQQNQIKALQQQSKDNASNTALYNFKNQYKKDRKTIQTSIDHLQRQINALKKQLRQPKPAKKVVKQLPVGPPRVPFNLVSIDQWGHETLAVFSFDGRLVSRHVGEILSNWTIKQIDTTQQRVELGYKKASVWAGLSS